MLIPQTMFVNMTSLHELNPAIREPAVCVTVVSKWCTINITTMLKKSSMVFVDQKVRKVVHKYYNYFSFILYSVYFF